MSDRRERVFKTFARVAEHIGKHSARRAIWLAVDIAGLRSLTGLLLSTRVADNGIEHIHALDEIRRCLPVLFQFGAQHGLKLFLLAHFLEQMACRSIVAAL